MAEIAFEYFSELIVPGFSSFAMPTSSCEKGRRTLGGKTRVFDWYSVFIFPSQEANTCLCKLRRIPSNAVSKISLQSGEMYLKSEVNQS